jgi:hypothetical protein
MPVRVLATEQYILNLRTRMPFRYGITTLNAVPHLFLKVDVEIDGRRQTGIAADSLPPKWFTKDPDSSARDDVMELLAVIESACTIARAVPASRSVFAFWKYLYEMQAAWGGGWGKPPLLYHFGTSLVERAVIDAFCKQAGVPFWRAARENLLGIDLGVLQPELAGTAPRDFLPPEPLRQITARHTIGMVDFLSDEEVPAAERLDDGLPQSLEACVRTYGLTHFKLKLWGDVPRDIERVRRVAEVVERNVPGGDYAFTADANENFKAVEPFREFWEKLAAEPALANFVRRVIFVEQPLHRGVALSPEVGRALASWPDRPPLIIDESDGQVETAREAIELGYAGTSHKNCKGVIKGLANCCLIESRSRNDPAKRYLMSGEDLANVGPVALLQDLAVVAALGIGNVERNGHHYFRGLTALPQDVQAGVQRAHSDLYQMTSERFAAARIEGGIMRIGSVVDGPFGTAFALDPARFTPIGEWRWEAL